MKKNVFKRLIALILAIVCIACFSTIAYAVAATVYSNIELEVVATIENKTYGGIKYTAVGGMAVGTNRTSMFVVKAERHDQGQEQKALFYDYPNISNPANRHIYLLPQAGHANGMAIDDSNIYVCGWTMEKNTPGNQAGNDENNWIIKIPRNKFSSFRDMNDGQEIPMDDPDTTAVEGYSVLIPLVEGTETVFNKEIRAITKYNSNKSFIVEYLMSGVGNNLAYTTASLVTVGGVENFYVSEDPDDIFIVQNNVQYADGTRQDICYSPGNGLFIPIWYGNDDNPQYYNENKNVIMWVDLSTSNNPKLSTITIGGKTYRYYTKPDKINVNQSNNGYTKFEVESIAITDSDEMLFSANIEGSGELANKDSVFSMTHDGGQNFVLS